MAQAMDIELSQPLSLATKLSMVGVNHVELVCHDENERDIVINEIIYNNISHCTTKDLLFVEHNATFIGDIAFDPLFSIGAKLRYMRFLGELLLDGKVGLRSGMDLIAILCNYMDKFIVMTEGIKCNFKVAADDTIGVLDNVLQRIKQREYNKETCSEVKYMTGLIKKWAKTSVAKSRTIKRKRT